MRLEYKGKIEIPSKFQISYKTKIHLQSSFIIGVLVLKGHTTLIFFKIIPDPCCESLFDHKVQLDLPS